MKYLVRKHKTKRKPVIHIWHPVEQNTACLALNSPNFNKSKFKLSNKRGKGRMCKVCIANMEKHGNVNPNTASRNAKFRKELKENPTKSELKAREILDHFGVNYKFQKGFYSHDFSFIVDFFIPNGRFVIEIDGGYHETQQQAQKDAWRDKKLREKRGCTIIRVKNEDVNESYIESILRKHNLIKDEFDFEITEEFLLKGISDRGAYNKKQTKALGVGKLRKGWKKRLIGKKIPKHRADKFLEYKNSHLKKTT